MTSTTPATVLVVDDDESIRTLLRRLLTALGHRVLTAPDGLAGLTTARTAPVDLILLDGRMPGMHGATVLHQLKADAATRDIPVIIISADQDLATIVACISDGAEDYLVKPFQIVILEARVNTSLDKRRLRLQEQAYQRLLAERVVAWSALANRRGSVVRRQSAVMESVLTSMGDGVVVVDLAGRLLHNNPAAARILGDDLSLVLPNGHDTRAALPLARAIAGEAVEALEVELPAGAGRPARWLSISAHPVYDSPARLLGGVAVIRDITSGMQATAALRASEERYALAAIGANDGLWDWDLRDWRIYYSPRWKAMLGYAEDALDDTPTEWFTRVHPEDRQQLHVRLAAHHRRLLSHFEHEYRIRASDGSYRWVLCRGLAVWDEAGNAVRMVGSQTDITARKEVEAQLMHTALYDSLTGLPNRTLFLNRLEHAAALATVEPAAAMLFVGLDRFKLINDSFGHAVGDAVLVAVAQRLAASLRPGDTVARQSGDEFVILIEDPDVVRVAAVVAERIHAAIAEPLPLAEQTITVSASIGIALLTSDISGATLVRNADTAMYHAKLRGKRRTVVFDPSMYAAAIARMQLEADLHDVLARDELRVHYQPIVALDGGALVGFEALVRWQHPAHGLLAPSSFLSVAEEAGLLAALSWWVLESACRQLAVWQNTLEHGARLWVSINMAPEQLSRPDTSARIAALLEELRLPPHALKLEITEHSLVTQHAETAHTLAQLRALGIQVCVDDFGTGYSSLSYLQRLQIDVLKIDRSFVAQLGSQGEGRAIVATILTLARALGLQVVAEGTETAEQAEALQELRCDLAQGWLFAKALPPEQVAAYVAEHAPLRAV